MALRKEDGKEFTLEQALAVATGYFLGEQGTFGTVYEVLDYMTGESLFTHALPRAGHECKPYVLQWYPELGYTDEQMEAGFKKYGGWREFVDVLVALHGKTRILWTIPMDDHDVIDPIEEAQAMMGDDSKIITIDISEDEISPYGDIGFSQENEP